VPGYDRQPFAARFLAVLLPGTSSPSWQGIKSIAKLQQKQAQ
jgi:hypothetical protein